jgi:hypothetical protein
MEVSAQRAQEIIEGIRDLGCRIKGLDPKKFRVKQGGGVHQTAVFDWYFSDQNVEGSIDTKKAYEEGLVRRTYGIIKASPNSAVILRVLEWSAAIDQGTSKYRQIWSKPADERGAKEELANYFADNLLVQVA